MAGGGRHRRRVVVDTDPGVDDAMALALAAACGDELVLEAVCTVFGNVPVEVATANAHRVLAAVGRPDVPVFCGAAGPMAREPRAHPAVVHGADGLGNTWDPHSSPHLPRLGGRSDADSDAVRYLVEAAHAHPHQLTVLTIGPVTNLAMALKRDPSIAPLLAEVVVMGGAVDVNGNVTPAGEANMLCDPHAADAVLTAPFPSTVLVPLDVSMRTSMNDAHLARLRAEAPRVGPLLADAASHYVAFHERRYGARFLHLHDPSAVAYLVRPELFETRAGPVRVVTEGLAVGQTIQDTRQDWLVATEWTDRPPVRVCTGIDADAVRDLFMERVIAADSHNLV